MAQSMSSVATLQLVNELFTFQLCQWATSEPSELGS